MGRGKELERLIRKAAKALCEYQVAKLWKIPNDLRMTGGELMAYGEEQPADFIGHTATGRVVMVEAKMHNAPSLPIGSRSGVTPYQWTSLLECHKAGGIALIVWQRESKIATIDMDIASSLCWERKSVPWKKIPPRFIHHDNPRVHMDMFDPYLQILKV